MGPFTQEKTKKKAQKGIALVAVLIIAGVLIIIGMAFYSMGAYEAGLYERRSESEQAFCKAESGVERARWVLVETQSKSAAIMDSAGIQVYAVDEIDPFGNVVNAGQNLIEFMYNVRVKSRGIEKGQEREIVAIFTPGMLYACACAQHITFHGVSNDWSVDDGLDGTNDVYIQGGLLYDHHINHPDHPWKYDWAHPDTILEPDWLLTQPQFRSFFEPKADTVIMGNQFWGDPGGGSPWDELPNNMVVYVKGQVNITENVREHWDTESVDVTIIATNTITVLNGKNDEDDRLVLIGLQNVVFEGDDPNNSLNTFVVAGNKVVTTNPGGAGAYGGEGALNGMIYLTFDVDMRGYDPDENPANRRGWRLTQRIETIALNGGLPVLDVQVAGLKTLRRISWAEIDPEV